ncbi:MAG: hypothetical protein OXG99_13960 [Alphaproteobacteria bacterium]|nr:hypothetical protein [Alphaproteobacteria bacterium]
MAELASFTVTPDTSEAYRFNNDEVLRILELYEGRIEIGASWIDDATGLQRSTLEIRGGGLWLAENPLDSLGD